MTKQELVQIMLIISKVYPNFRMPEPKGELSKVDVWYALIGDIPFENAKKATFYVLNTCKFEPKPADIREALNIAFLHNAPTVTEAWGEVLRKANIYKQNIGWSHPYIRAAVEAIGLHNICMSENGATDRAHFYRAYNNILNRKEQEKSLAACGLIGYTGTDIVGRLELNIKTMDFDKRKAE